jgi:hypothetical protein
VDARPRETLTKVDAAQEQLVAQIQAHDGLVGRRLIQSPLAFVRAPVIDAGERASPR